MRRLAGVFRALQSPHGPAPSQVLHWDTPSAKVQVGELASLGAGFVEARLYEQLVLFISSATSFPVDASYTMQNAAVL